jgi:hypothetical protein
MMKISNFIPFGNLPIAFAADLQGPIYRDTRQSLTFSILPKTSIFMEVREDRWILRTNTLVDIVERCLFVYLDLLGHIIHSPGAYPL